MFHICSELYSYKPYMTYTVPIYRDIYSLLCGVGHDMYVRNNPCMVTYMFFMWHILAHAPRHISRALCSYTTYIANVWQVGHVYGTCMCAGSRMRPHIYCGICGPYVESTMTYTSRITHTWQHICYMWDNIGTCTQIYIESIMLLYDIYCTCMASRAHIWDMYVCWDECASSQILGRIWPIPNINCTYNPYMEHICLVGLGCKTPEYVHSHI